MRGARVVLDPQKPRGIRTLSDVADIEADAVLLAVLNEDETRALGESGSVEDAARNLLSFRHLPIEAVITKRGPRGALVTTVSSVELVGPRWTPSVYSIGSGDVFAAGAAWAWAEQGPTRWPRQRSARARQPGIAPASEVPVPVHALESCPFPPVRVDHAAKVYLAGPFFNLAQRWLVDLVEYALRPSRFSPMHDVGPGSSDVAALDLAGLGECSVRARATRRL